LSADINNTIAESGATIDTIAAVSTPPGRGGIGIVRLSGPQATSISAQLVSLRRPLEHARARIADVLDELHGANAKGYAVVWLGNQPSADEIAKRVSPINYVNRNNPPIITIHGDKDTLVPYQQSVRLHKALDAAGVPNRLVTMLGAGHGGFTYEENQRAWAAIREFLGKHVRGLKDPTPAK